MHHSILVHRRSAAQEVEFGSWSVRFANGRRSPPLLVFAASSSTARLHSKADSGSVEAAKRVHEAAAHPRL